MSLTDSDSEDAITNKEIAGEASAPPASQAGVSSTTTQRNAFSELMKSKAKVPAQPTKDSTSKSSSLAISFKGRDGLGAYTHDPAVFPPSRVIYYDDDFVVINDLYPKSSVHTLLLPRSPRSRLHPFDAFEDTDFLAKVQAEALKLKQLVAKELQRRYGQYSERDKVREAVLNGELEWNKEELPEGREWEREAMVGIHAHPSMNDLHVHVISRDMFSECLQHRKHYESFNTPFFIDVTDFPLAKNDPRRHPGRAGFLNQDLKCWRCGQNFGKKFKQLKEHLKEEFEKWKQE
ncbi:HIT domain-containing protein [Truncatella angustata]|uniref:Aprataxin-like protein n=1 Tax=Truncatella angustata TaxID=152316 RepID=A0A9P8UFR1_9PEZI|nr:HIT domain-containing protein [Truncatella angustata]KAH6649155.1 HIT domain-containing protein [Truncatella angustata]KAH8195936.1 hypothetical protein TruAng_009885 [Truncatella angustata]